MAGGNGGGDRHEMTRFLSTHLLPSFSSLPSHSPIHNSPNRPATHHKTVRTEGRKDLFGDLVCFLKTRLRSDEGGSELCHHQTRRTKNPEPIGNIYLQAFYFYTGHDNTIINFMNQKSGLYNLLRTKGKWSGIPYYGSVRKNRSCFWKALSLSSKRYAA